MYLDTNFNKKNFTTYTRCTFCNSKKLKKKPYLKIKENFYTKAIISDLFIKKKEFEKLATYECQKCFLIQVSPWFNKKITRKIYSNIYGQHNKNWNNYLSFIKNGNLPNHGKLFDLIIKNIHIKNYGEYNSPFMGLFFNYFSKEYKCNLKFYKSLSLNLIDYLSSRQLAGKSKNEIKKAETTSKKLIKKIKLIKRKNFLKSLTNKYLLTDNSEMCWGQNDNYKSVNSRSLASELFDLEIIDLNHKEKIKFDLFSIFLTLDHTFEPKKILDYALTKSNYVIVQCHTSKTVTKQHQFSFSYKFLNYLSSINIYHKDLTKIINKKFSSNELYFICSKKNSLIKKLKFN